MAAETSGGEPPARREAGAKPAGSPADRAVAYFSGLPLGATANRSESPLLGERKQFVETLIARRGTHRSQASATPEPAPGPRLLKFRPGMAQTLLRRAIDGARMRLDKPLCQQVLTDYATRDGRTLLEELTTRGSTASGYLSKIWFVDESDSARCRGHGREAAFTQVNSRVIHVCASRFASRDFRLEGAPGEMVIIHEMLHSLGLEENPPTPAEITARVTERCS